MWCLWKARNEVLFCRKFSLPHQVQHAALAISSLQDFHEQKLQEVNPASPTLHTGSEQMGQPLQGSTIKSDAIISGTKVYSDASWKNNHIPGRSDLQATGIGIFIFIPGDDFDTKIMIQASANSTHSPLVAEALALQFAAKVACRLQLHNVSFLTNNLSLAKMVVSRNIKDNSIAWRCRPQISSFMQDSSSELDAIYHIPRNINSIAHNCAHQVLNSRIKPVLSCTNSAHSPCPSMLSLQDFQVEGFVIHAVLCKRVE